MMLKSPDETISSMMTQFARNTKRIQNVLEIMNDRKERNWREIAAEMNQRYGMHVARATLYYYFEELINDGKMAMSKKRVLAGRGRPRTFFKIIASVTPVEQAIETK